MFYGVPGGLSGAGWGTQDANGVWSGMAGNAQNQSGYNTGGGAAFGAQSTPYSGGGTGAYTAGLPTGGAAPVQPNYSTASFGAAPTQNVNTAGSFGPAAPTTPDMGQYLRGLDWSPQNAQNATKQMTQAMGQYGWTADQVGQNLGFNGADIMRHIFQYGGMGGGGALGATDGGGSDPLQGFDWRNTTGDARLYAQGGNQMMNAGGSPNWLSGNGGAYQPGIANDPTGGGGLGSNPYMGAQADFLRQQMQDALGQNLQSIRSNSVGNRTLGGSRQGVAEGLALKGFDQSYGSNLANMLSGNYQFDRNLNTSSYNQNRGLDLQQAQLGGNLMNQGLNMQWSPIQNANAQYTPYTGLGSQSTPGSGGGLSGAIGGGLSGLALAAQLGLFK